jgi:hypothetical protein
MEFFFFRMNRIKLYEVVNLKIFEKKREAGNRCYRRGRYLIWCPKLQKMSSQKQLTGYRLISCIMFLI